MKTFIIYILYRYFKRLCRTRVSVIVKTESSLIENSCSCVHVVSDKSQDDPILNTPDGQTHTIQVCYVYSIFKTQIDW